MQNHRRFTNIPRPNARFTAAQALIKCEGFEAANLTGEAARLVPSSLAYACVNGLCYIYCNNKVADQKQ